MSLLKMKNKCVNMSDDFGEQHSSIVAQLPSEHDLSQSLYDGDESKLQQLLSCILDYVIQLNIGFVVSDESSNNDSNKQQLQVCENLVIGLLRKEQELQINVNDDSIMQDNTDIVSPTDDSNITFIVSDCFVDALWFSTSCMDQAASSCTTLVTFMKNVCIELYQNNCMTNEQSSDMVLDDENIIIKEQVYKKEQQIQHLITRLLESCNDATFLEAIGIIPSATEFQKKLRTTNTTINYRQNKFNLLAEESEGYSKLIHYVSLTTPSSVQGSSSLTTTTAIHNNTKRTIANLISTFSLDPNRCIDICIDVLECQICWYQQDTSRFSRRCTFLFHCIHACNSTGKLPQLLGFKLKGRVEKQIDNITMTAKDETDRSVTSLLRCMALLLQPFATVDLKTTNGTAEMTHSTIQILNPSEMIHYMPDCDIASYKELVQSTFNKILHLERERLMNIGRVRLSGNTTTASKKSTTPVADALTIMKPLQDVLIIQWMHVLLEQKSVDGFDTIRTIPIFQEQWAELSYLFPSIVGVAICDWVHAKVLNFYRIVCADPSHNELSTTDNELVVSLDSVLDAIFDPLLETWESGCIVLRPVLYSQVCRLLAYLMKQEKEKYGCVLEENKKLINFLRYFLLPSLSLFPSNSALSMEIWNVLEIVPYGTRYTLYKSWRGSGLERDALKSTCDKPLWLIESELVIGKDARYALKRLSKDTIRDMSRSVAKCCHSHPMVVFTTILMQIESYDNLVQVMVDSFRFVTHLSLDVLGYCILERLIGDTTADAGTKRNRLKENGVYVSQWLQSLESFTGVFYKRFPYIEFQGILCYIIQRIKAGHVTELGMLKTLLKSSGGWSFSDYSPTASLSASQLEGRSGSTLLKQETMFFGVVEDININASQVVRRVLQNGDIGVSLLILLSQVKNKIVYTPADKSGRHKPIKLIGNLVDMCQVVIYILLDFLTNSFDDGLDDASSQLLQYANSLPSLKQLLEVYKMDLASAWMLCRPVVRAAKKLDSSSPDQLNESRITDFLLTEQSREAYNQLFTPETWSCLSPELVEAFYSISLYDLHYPEDLYTAEIQRLEKDIDRLSRVRGASQQISISPLPTPDKTDKEEAERMKKVSESLQKHSKVQKQHVAVIHNSLKSKAAVLFSVGVSSSEKAMIFLHRCVYPRCIQSPDDAMFCARFVYFLHENETVGFSTLHFHDALVTVLSRALFCLTEDEAACVSILLSESWKMLSRWRYDEDLCASELLEKPGSLIADSTEVTTVEEYKSLYNKWHATMGASCLGCLQSPEYMHLRNCLVVLTRMVDVYPTRPKLANDLLKALEPLQDESNPFADIRASAQAYSMQLVKARGDGVWKEEDAATIQIRMENELAAAEKRHRNAEEKMAEMKRDQEKITEEIGDSRDRDRGRTRTATSFGGIANKTFDTNTRNRDERRDQDDRRTDDRRRVEERRLSTNVPQTDRWPRDRQPGTAAYSSIATSASTGNRREDANNTRSLESRWQFAGDRDQQQPRGSKRSRPSSPVEQNEIREEQNVAATRPRVQDVLDDSGKQEDTTRNRRSAKRGRHAGRR